LFTSPLNDDNEEIVDHVKIHVEAKENEKSNIPAEATRTLQKRQLENVAAPYYQQAPNPYLRPVYPDLDSEREYKPSIHVNVKTEKKRDQISPARERRSLATEYTKNIMVPDRAENNLGVVHQKRVEEDIENSSKRNKILKLDKRGLYYEPPAMFWEPRATIRGNKANKNPILQLLRAAAGQKTQRILGLNSKAFDIFPGPMPDEQNVALNNNLGKVSNEAPTQIPVSVDQQIMQNFRRPGMGRHTYQPAQPYGEAMMSMYPAQPEVQAPQPQQPLQRQQLEYQPAMLQQQEYAAPQQLGEQEAAFTEQQQQQQEQPIPQQFAQRRHQFSSFSTFPAQRTRGFAAPDWPSYGLQRRQYAMQRGEPLPPSIQQQQQESVAQRRQQMLEEEALVQQQQQQQQQMFMRPSPRYAALQQRPQQLYRPQPIEEMAPQTRGLPQYTPSSPTQMEMYQPRPSEVAQPLLQETASLRELQKAQAMPEMKYNEQDGSLTEAPLQHSRLPEMIAQNSVPMSPMEESRKILGGSLTSSSSLQEETPAASILSNKLYQLPSESRLSPSERRFLPEMPWLQPESSTSSRRQLYPYPGLHAPRASLFSSQPYYRAAALPRYPALRRFAPLRMPHHASRIPHAEDDDVFDEKPEVHVHIQTEKSHISKPSENLVSAKKATKKG